MHKDRCKENMSEIRDYSIMIPAGTCITSKISAISPETLLCLRNILSEQSTKQKPTPTKQNRNLKGLAGR